MRQDIVGLHGSTPPKGTDANKGTKYLRDDDCFHKLFRAKENMTFDVDLKDKLDRFAQNNEVTEYAGYKIVRLRITSETRYAVGNLMQDIAKSYNDPTLDANLTGIKEVIRRKYDPHACYLEFCGILSNKPPLLLIITNFYEEIGTLSETDVRWLSDLLKYCRNIKMWICAERGWYKDKKSIYQDLHQKFEAVPKEFFVALQNGATLPYLYFSYSWEPISDDTVNDISDVARLCQLPYRRDKDHCGYRANITEFMDMIREGKYVIVVFGKEYLKSYYCLYELTGVLNHVNYKDRLYPIVVDDEIRSDVFYSELCELWKSRKDDMDYLKGISCCEGVDLPFERKVEIMEDIIDKLPMIKAYIDNINEGNYISHVEGGYMTIMVSIIDQIASRK